jgi:hypothetical protein
MKQEIVLPKFKIPGQTNWLVRGLWIGGGVVVLLTFVVVWALTKQRSQEAQAARDLARQTQLAAAAQAAAPAAAPVKPAAAGRPLATRAAEPGKPAAAPLVAGKTKSAARAGHLGRKKPTRQAKLFTTKTAARAAARPAPKPKAAGGKGDAIDDILRNFK